MRTATLVNMSAIVNYHDEGHRVGKHIRLNKRPTYLFIGYLQILLQPRNASIALVYVEYKGSEAKESAHQCCSYL